MSANEGEGRPVWMIVPYSDIAVVQVGGGGGAFRTESRVEAIRAVDYLNDMEAQLAEAKAQIKELTELPEQGHTPLEQAMLHHIHVLRQRAEEAEAIASNLRSRFDGFREGARIGAEWSRKEVAFWKQRAQRAEARAQRAEDAMKAYHQDFYQTNTVWFEEAKKLAAKAQRAEAKSALAEQVRARIKGGQSVYAIELEFNEVFWVGWRTSYDALTAKQGEE